MRIISGEYYDIQESLEKAHNPIHGNNNYGLQEEDRLVQRLGMMLNDDYICVRGAMVAKKLDADVLLIGPSGIWILESKYISGRIIKGHYGWHRGKLYHEIGGALTQQNDRLDNVESQWKREKEAVVRALRNRGLHPFQSPIIKGGVVFTHHNSELDLQEPVYAEVGDIAYWCHNISDELENRVLTGRQILDVVNAILQNARRFNPNNRSAVVVAEEFFSYKKKYLLRFIDRNKTNKVNESSFSGGIHDDKRVPCA